MCKNTVTAVVLVITGLRLMDSGLLCGLRNSAKVVKRKPFKSQNKKLTKQDKPMRKQGCYIFTGHK